MNTDVRGFPPTVFMDPGLRRDDEARRDGHWTSRRQGDRGEGPLPPE
jgi:hypothetical protein